jgi:ABC-type amino acid transport substrate-binding protein
MPRRWPALWIAAALAAGRPASAQGPDTLVFGTAHEPDTTVFGYATDYLQRLCAEISQRCLLQSLPGRRSEAMLADGSLAGEMGRVRSYSIKHPEYQRLDEPFAYTRTYIFTKAHKPDISSWQELARQAHTVSYKRGIYTFQLQLEALQPGLRPHDVQSVPACFQMVLTGRDQACVFDDGSLSAESKRMLAQGRIGKPLEDLGLYIYLSRDHAALAPLMTEAARRLNAQGLRAQLRRKHFDGR